MNEETYFIREDAIVLDFLKDKVEIQNKEKEEETFIDSSVFIG